MADMSGDEQNLNDRLDSLLAAYRRACPDPQASPDFMPRLWQRIEERRTSTYDLRKWAQAFVTAAMAICLLLGILLTTASQQQSVFYGSTYLEALASEGTPESYPDFELVSTDNGGGTYC